MESIIYKSITNQFKRLLESRDNDNNYYFMNNGSKKTINVCRNNSIIFTINISEFTREDIITSSHKWNLYKTNLLNNNLDKLDKDCKLVTPVPIVVSLNDIFDKIYVITIEEDDSNIKLIDSYFKKYNIDYELFKGINGINNNKSIQYYNKYLSLNKKDKRIHELERNYKQKMIRSVGAMGYLLTWELILEDAIKNKYNKIMIFDDDVLFDKHFNQKINDILHNIKKFKLLYLGCSYYNSKHDIININNQNYKLCSTYTDGSFSVGIDSSIYEILLEQIRQFNCAVDSGPLRYIIKNYKNECFMFNSSLVIADVTKISKTTNFKRNLRDHCKLVHWQLQNIDFTRATLKVSVIIPNYNNGDKISFCLDSMLNQTYKNLEIIVCDDNSTDNSVDIIKMYIDKYKQIKLIESDVNSGTYAMRNVGLKNATGFFIAICDSDDFYLSQKIEKDVYNYFNNPTFDVFFSNIYRSNVNFNKIDDNYVLNIIDDEQKKIFEKRKSLPWDYKIRFGLATSLFEIDFFKKYGMWREDYRFGMDLEIIQRYIYIKYKKIINATEIWTLIYNNKATKYDIFIANDLNYISFPMNEENSTNKYNNDLRNTVHERCMIELINETYIDKIEFLNYSR